MSEPFIAEIKITAINFAPRGWARCDGQTLPIAQNTALFSLLGTTFGGDGRTTVGLPNLRDRVPMHPGRGPGLTARRLGEAGGSESHTLTLQEVPAHNHGWQVSNELVDQKDPTNNVLAKSPSRRGGYLLYGAAQNLGPMASQTVADSGGGRAHTNLQPVLPLNFIIALQGLFPSRS